jgi:hypothetical protein
MTAAAKCVRLFSYRPALRGEAQEMSHLGGYLFPPRRVTVSQSGRCEAAQISTRRERPFLCLYAVKDLLRHACSSGGKCRALVAGSGMDFAWESC